MIFEKDAAAAVVVVVMVRVMVIGKHFSQQKGRENFKTMLTLSIQWSLTYIQVIIDRMTDRCSCWEIEIDLPV